MYEATSMDFDHTNGLDFYDVPVPANPDPSPNGTRNKAVALTDVLAVLFYVGASEGGGPNANGVDYDSDKNADTFPDGRDYDRSPSAEPNPPWDAGPPATGRSIARPVLGGLDHGYEEGAWRALDGWDIGAPQPARRHS